MLARATRTTKTSASSVARVENAKATTRMKQYQQRLPVYGQQQVLRKDVVINKISKYMSFISTIDITITTVAYCRLFFSIYYINISTLSLCHIITNCYVTCTRLVTIKNNAIIFQYLTFQSDCES